MFPLLAVLIIATVAVGLTAYLVARLGTAGAIAGSYHESRLLPGQINGRLRRKLFLQRLVWSVALLVVIAVGSLVQYFNADAIMADGGFWYEALYASVLSLGLPLVAGQFLIYGGLLLLTVGATFLAVGLGVKFAARKYLLTRSLPAIA